MGACASARRMGLTLLLEENRREDDQLKFVRAFSLAPVRRVVVRDTRQGICQIST
jgi:hypothetical protein